MPDIDSRRGSEGASFVTVLAPGDGSVITESIITFLDDRLPPASSLIALLPPSGSETDAQLTPVLTAGLERRGYGLASDATFHQTPNDIHQIRYFVTSLNDAILLRLRVDNGLLSCLFVRDSHGTLGPAGPCTQLDKPQ